MFKFVRLLCLMLVVGCGNGLIPIKTAPVSGSATFDGKPLENYKVFFYCEASEAMEPSTGLVGSDGTFKMTVRNPGDGVIVGMNKVWLTYDPPMPEQKAGMETAWNPPPAKVKLPQKFMSGDTSGVTVEVSASGLTGYKLELKP